MTNRGRFILLYDGDCRFCNRWVQWVVDRDVDSLFRFAALESFFSEGLHNYLNIERRVNSIAIIEINDLLLINKDTQFKYKSEAVECLFVNLSPNALLYKLMRVVPGFIADFAYNCVAAIRKILPVTNCRLYTSEERKLFLNDRDFVDFISLSI